MPRPAKIQVVSKKEIGERLRALRREQGLTQAALAKILGTNQANVSGLERGKRSLTIHQVVKLAVALHASTDEILLGGKPGKEKNDGHSRDWRFLRRLRHIDRLSERRKQALLMTIDAYLGKQQ